MVKVTDVKFSTGGKNLGEFHCDTFNLFDPEDRELWIDLRNRAADASNGIKIELVREYSTKKTETESMESGASLTRTSDEITLVVHYWVKKVVGKKSSGPREDQEERTAISR